MIGPARTRLVTWNVSRDLRRKRSNLETLRPDIAVLQEVSQRDMEAYPGSFWTGQLPNKGLGVAAFNGWRVEVDPAWDARIEFVVPLRVFGPAAFTLLAAWVMSRRAVRVHPDHPERGQMLQALDAYRPLLREGSAVVAGDFNNAVRWDTPHGRANHSTAVAGFSELGMVSAYHVFAGVDQGHELDPTIYWTWNQQKPYHIDYIWLPVPWSKGMTVEVGDYATWVEAGLSDHVPVLAEFSIPRS